MADDGENKGHLRPVRSSEIPPPPRVPWDMRETIQAKPLREDVKACKRGAGMRGWVSRRGILVTIAVTVTGGLVIWALTGAAESAIASRSSQGAKDQRLEQTEKRSKENADEIQNIREELAESRAWRKEQTHRTRRILRMLHEDR